MHLLLDTANATSPGLSRLHSELVRTLLELRPIGCRLTVVTTDPTRLASMGCELIEVSRATSWRALSRWYRHGLPELAGFARADVTFSMGGIVSRALCRRTAAISSINNMLPFTGDLMRQYRPWSRERARLVLLRHAYLASARRASLVVFPSVYGRNKVEEYLGPMGDKAMVIPNPIPAATRVDPNNLPPHPYRGRPYFFYLSAVYRYKNHLNLIEGYRRALEAQPDLPDLLIAGLPVDAEYVTRIKESVTQPGLRGKARFLGKIDGQTIPGWLHHATINLFPSTCETNSVVQAEILGASGVMACSSWAPMPEIAGDAAELFDPLDPRSIADVILQLNADSGRRDALREAARRRCEDFAPQTYGNAVWEAAEQALKRFSA